MVTMDDALYGRITALAGQGDRLVNEGDNAGALEKYHEAWMLVPDPKEDWEASTWLLAAIADAHFFARDFDLAAKSLTIALRCPSALGNAFIHLRLGQALFELGERAKAGDELARAYMGAGREIFVNEEPKYFAFLETLLVPPQGTKSL